MNFKQLSIAALLAVSGIAANATVTASLGGDTNAADFITLSSANVFNGDVYTDTTANGGFIKDSSGTVIAAAPTGTALNTQFLAAGPSHGNGYPYAQLSLALPGTHFVSFDWGSVDSANTVSIEGAGGVILATFKGTDIPGISITNPQTSYEVSFTSSDLITAIQFGSPGVNAFEVSNVSVTAVPEPSNIALMLAGLGAFGLVARKRRI